MRKRISILTSILAALMIVYGAWAATYTDFVSGDLTLSRSGIDPQPNWVPFIQYREFDFGHANINDGSGVTNGDIVRLFNVTADTYVEEIGYRVTRASLKSGTSAEIGDGNDADGYVGNDITTNRVPFVDLSNTSAGISKFNVSGTFLDGQNDGGATTFTLSGVSISLLSPVNGAGVTVFGGLYMASNNGPYFTDNSGASFYGSNDTIDMTVYVDKSFDPTSTSITSGSGVTPRFEAYIKGFKRVVP